jgi:alpha-mannosidase
MHAKKIHLICNAHLDPVWLWRWNDGLAEAISTFRIAADFCEKHPGFIFNHNEALLYRWVETNAPELFSRIRKLVKSGSWHIAGGSWVQPDINTPSGESHIRQFLMGKRYFAEKFGMSPKIAYNFDSFGHPEGYAQILAGCGFDGYIFCRPDYRSLQLPEKAFIWKDRSGASVYARRSSDHYLSNGNEQEKLEKWLPVFKDEPESMILWGLGNHGGGASVEALAEFKRWFKEHPHNEMAHSTPERFFAAVARDAGKRTVIKGEMQLTSPGCYTSMAAIKRAHRRAENLALTVEKLCGLAWWRSVNAYPREEINSAWRDILFCEFHDILPGSCIKSAEKDALACLAHSAEILNRAKTRAFISLVRASRKAHEGEVPIFIFNPHGCPITAVIEPEYMIGHKGIEQRYGAAISIRDDSGKSCICQREKEESNVPFDWMVRMAVPVSLGPFEIKRLNASFKKNDAPAMWHAPVARGNRFAFRNEFLSLVLNLKTGLIDHCSIRGIRRSAVARNAFQLVVFADLDNSWQCGTPQRKKTAWIPGGLPWTSPKGRFRLATVAEASALASPPLDKRGIREIKPVNIIEDGPVRTIIEAIFVWESSTIVRHYIFGKIPASFEIHDTIYWQGKDAMLKMEVPLAYPVNGTISETPYSAVFRKQPDLHRDAPNQRWVAVVPDEKEAPVLAIVNDGSFAHSMWNNRLYCNVLRSPAYSSFGLKPELDIHAKRVLPRQDQGEHTISWRLELAARFDETRVRRAADLLNAPPEVLIYYPGGDNSGKSIGNPRKPPFINVSRENVSITAVKKAESREALVVRLQETAGKTTRYELKFEGEKRAFRGKIGAYQVRSAMVEKKKGKLRFGEVNFIERKMA